MADTPAQIAKAALRRLAQQQLEPTPENYARAWVDEGGAGTVLPPRARGALERLLQRAVDDPARRGELLASLLAARWDDAQRQLDAVDDPGPAWAALIARVARGVERGGRHWTQARRKDSLQRVLDGSRSDAQRLQQRLQQLLAQWEHDAAADFVDTGLDAGADALRDDAGTVGAPPAGATAVADATAATAWPALADHLGRTLREALPRDDMRAAALADELAQLADAVARDGADAATVARIGDACERARRWLGHRQHLVDQLAALCRELTAGLADLAEDASWAQGQVRAIEARLDAGVSARGVKAAAELLAHTRARQQQLRAERDRARDALRALVASLLAQLGDVDARTGGYGERLGQYEARIREADSIDQLAGLVQQMLADNREVRDGVHAARERLAGEHARALELEQRVRALEDELRRLSDEVSTDALTEVANRRGLLRAFEGECARTERAGHDGASAPLAIGLLDIDNFKKLNDTLGHAAGDVALKSLAARVRDALRPGDTLGRWGGEEFVVLLPGAAVDEARQVLTRLQRALTASLFLHEGREVFVTFSAGVTAWTPGETIDAALERADEALYEAKRAGKNRTCIA
ncbi:MAG: diguanylate cyclase domain-containing protein [Gammaproteobacteria bacterium]